MKVVGADRPLLHRAFDVVKKRIIRIIMSFAIVTIFFILLDKPFYGTTAAILAWVLISMFVAISSCMLTINDVKPVQSQKSSEKED